MKITGVMVQYYAICKRELWFFAKGINQDYEDENIMIGRWLQKKSYSEEEKDILIDNTINIDFVSGKDGVVVHEIKKSSKIKAGVRAQILYYLWYLKHKKGLETTGVIVYPKERRRESIALDEEKEKEIEKMLKGIEEVVSQETLPPIKEKPFCKNCSYFEFCWC